MSNLQPTIAQASIQKTPKKLEIDPGCLWGLDVSKMNPDDKIDGDTFIARVFDAGNYRDMVRILEYYGQERVKASLLEYPELQTKTINYLALLFNLDPNQFYAFNRRSKEQIAHPSF